MCLGYSDNGWPSPFPEEKSDVPYLTSKHFPSRFSFLPFRAAFLYFPECRVQERVFGGFHGTVQQHVFQLAGSYRHRPSRLVFEVDPKGRLGIAP